MPPPWKPAAGVGCRAAYTRFGWTASAQVPQPLAAPAASCLFSSSSSRSCRCWPWCCIWSSSGPPGSWSRAAERVWVDGWVEGQHAAVLHWCCARAAGLQQHGCSCCGTGCGDHTSCPGQALVLVASASGAHCRAGCVLRAAQPASGGWLRYASHLCLLCLGPWACSAQSQMGSDTAVAVICPCKHVCLPWRCAVV